MYTYRIETDDFPQNPRDEFENLSTFYGVSGRYLVGGKNDITYKYDDYLEDTISQLRRGRAIVIEFESDAGTCYAVVERDQLKKEYLDHGYSVRRAFYWARQCAKGEIAEWLAYCNGEVYGFIVEDEDGNHIESCWGFYGEDGRKSAEQEAESIIQWHQEQEKQAEEFVNTQFAL